MRRFALVLAVVACGSDTARSGGPVSAAQFANEFHETQAQQTVMAWLALVDRGEYDSSWDEAAAMFQRSVGREEWREAAAKLRGPLGKLRSRTFRMQMWSERLPGAPVGQYMVSTYRSDFEDQEGAEETVTAVVGGTRGWRVGGYMIEDSKAHADLAPDLRLTIRAEPSDPKVGDEVMIEFTVRNAGKSVFEYNKYADDECSPGFNLRVTTPDGQAVRGPRGGIAGSCLGGTGLLGPGASFHAWRSLFSPASIE
jgi:hypothetical protein